MERRRDADVTPAQRVYDLDLAYPRLQAALDRARTVLIDAARAYVEAPDTPRRDALTSAVERHDRAERAVGEWHTAMGAALRAQRLEAAGKDS